MSSKVRRFVIHHFGKLTNMNGPHSLHVALVESLDVSLRRSLEAFGSAENVLIILGCIAIEFGGGDCDMRALQKRTRLSRSTLDRRLNTAVNLGHVRVVKDGRRQIFCPTEEAIATVFQILAERYANLSKAISNPPKLDR